MSIKCAYNRASKISDRFCEITDVYNNVMPRLIGLIVDKLNTVVYNNRDLLL